MSIEKITSKILAEAQELKEQTLSQAATATAIVCF